MIKTLIGIEGMSCGMCEAHINDVIRRNFNVESVKSSRKKKVTEVVSKESLDYDIIRNKIGETGYEVTSISEENFVKRELFK